MDWSVLVSALLDRFQAPACVLGADGVLLGVNAPLAEIFGRDPTAINGSRWPAAARSVVQQVRDALTRVPTRIELPAHTSRGLMLLQARAEAIGTADSHSLLLVVESWRPAAEHVPSDGCEEYTVSTRAGDFGRILASQGVNGHDNLGRPCYVAFFGSTTPCRGCPLYPPGRAGDRRLGFVSHTPERVAMVQVSFLSEAVAHVSSRDMGPLQLQDLFDTRLRQLAQGCELSPRECDVLVCLTRGLDRDTIAEQLGISARTVKFHQTNAFRKLGVASPWALVCRLFHLEDRGDLH